VVSFNYQSIGYSGTDITFTAPTGGVLADGVNSADAKGFLWVENAAGGGTITVSIFTEQTSFGVAVPDIVVSIPDGERRLIGPLVPELASSSFLGAVAMTFAGTLTGVTAAAVKVP
jgi:hypothetical protein